MKKVIILVTLILAIAINAASAAGIDFSQMSNEEIQNIIDAANAELSSRNIAAAEGYAYEQEAVENDVEATIASLESELETLLADIDSFDKYIENAEQIEAFYNKVYKEHELLCIRMMEYSIGCARQIMDTDKPSKEKYSDLEEIYDSIYDDAGDDIYDGIYDGVLADMYDLIYDGILSDAYDTVPYKDWSAARSDEYKWWSNTRSDVYKTWSNCRSDIYDFWSDLRSEMFSDDIEEAEEVIAEFIEDIVKQGGGHMPAETQKTAADATEKAEEVSVELVDGMRPEFKEAMDAYEAFYNEYCGFMEEYKKNPTDLTLLTQYGTMLIKVAEMDKAFDEWDEGEMSNAELKYYLEVNNRVMQKLIDAAA